ncbi:MAG: cytochrome b/b6 domain-containing protein [Parasphingorhabdus sp.]|nr:cytochrome b/b6 domain-containing protein [Parasphingorhabdus sp.]
MSEHDPLALAPRIHVWDGPLRIFHWLLVIAIAVAFLSAEEDSLLSQWHMMAGWFAAILIAFRIVWGFIGGEHARFSEIFKVGGAGHHIGEMLRLKPTAALGHNPVGWISALLLIAVTAVVVWTGALLVTSGGGSAEELHEVIGWSLLALVAVHIVAVIFMSALTRENLVRAMVSGSKPAQRHAGASDARKPSLFAYLIGMVVVAAAIFGILKIDPQAFVPRSAESAEYGENQLGAQHPYEDEDDDIEHGE